MKYDFETLVDRKYKNSLKWNLMYNRKETVPTGIPPFSVADYDFVYPEILLKRFREYINTMVFGYTVADEGYYNSFINWVNRRHKFKMKREWILDGDGVVNGICNTINAFTDINDGVIIMPPIYPPFASSVLNNDRTLVECNLINDNNYYTIDFDRLEKLCQKDNNKVLVLCSPHNPVGRVWTKEELIKLSKICNDNNVLVISDEIHMDLILENYEHVVYGSLDEETLNNCVILTSASKSFNLAGTQTSFVVIPNPLLRKKYAEYSSLKAHVSTNSFGFKLTQIVYEDCEPWFNELLELIESNYEYLKSYLEVNIPKIKVVPMEGTYLTWLDCREMGLTDKELYDFLIDDCNVCVNSGDSYGESGSGYIRLNIATPKLALSEALDRIKLGYETNNI